MKRHICGYAIYYNRKNEVAKLSENEKRYLLEQMKRHIYLRQQENEAQGKSIVYLYRKEQEELRAYMRSTQFDQHLEEVLDNHLFLGPTILDKLVEYTVDQVMIHHKLKHIYRNDVILIIDQLDSRFFYQITKKVIGFITQKVLLDPDIMMCYAVDSKYKIYDQKKVIIFKEKHRVVKQIKKSRERNIKHQGLILENQFMEPLVHAEKAYQGVYIRHLNMLYESKQSVPYSDEIWEHLMNCLKGYTDKEIYIKLPSIRFKKSLKKEEVFFEDSYRLLELSEAYKALLIGLSMATYQFKIRVVLDHIATAQELSIWKEFIRHMIQKHSLSALPIGIKIKYESTMDYIEEFSDLEFAFIDLDHLYQELNDKEYQAHTFKYEFFEEMVENLREVHYFLKKKSIKHIVFGKMLTQEKVFKKLNLMGFKYFIVDEETSKVVNGHPLKESEIKAQ